MRRLLIFAILMTSFLIPYNVNAQDIVQIDQMEIDIWPEYDRPDVLVIYRITLSPDTSLPASITLSIPASAGQPNAVAYENVNGGLSTMQYETQLDGEWLEITFTALFPKLQIEYYDPSMERSGDMREFDYFWNADYAINDLVISIQEPVNASDFEIKQPVDNSFQLPNGLTIHENSIGEVAAGTPVSINLSYVKPDDTLAGLQPVQPVEPIPEQAIGFDLQNILPWILGAIGLALLLGGGYWYVQTTRARSRPKNPRRRHSSRRASGGQPGKSVYCHQCGKGSVQGDTFCRSCGTKLRIDG
jgi:hypothetical protein